MKLSAETFYLHNFMDDEDAVRLLASAGFDCVDYSLEALVNPHNAYNGDDWKARAKSIRRLGDELGISFNQAHAPFEFDWNKPNVVENEVIPRVARCFEVCNVLGVDTVVVHPLHYMRYRSENTDAIWDMNMRFYQKLLPLARELNVRIALENLFQFDARNVAMPDTCSNPDRYVRAIDELDDPHIVACVDVGHAALVGDDPAALILALGHERLKALHIHDNNAVVDSHTVPYLGGKIDWNSVCRALAKIDYDGVFTFESFNFYKNFEPAFFFQAARFIHDIGLYLTGKIEEYRKEAK